MIHHHHPTDTPNQLRTRPGAYPNRHRTNQGPEKRGAPRPRRFAPSCDCLAYAQTHSTAMSSTLSITCTATAAAARAASLSYCRRPSAAVFWRLPGGPRGVDLLLTEALRHHLLSDRTLGQLQLTHHPESAATTRRRVERGNEAGRRGASPRGRRHRDDQGRNHHRQARGRGEEGGGRRRARAVHRPCTHFFSFGLLSHGLPPPP